VNPGDARTLCYATHKAALAEKVEALVPSIAAGDFTVRVAESFPFTTEA
jgi:hypothetical protein